MLLKCLLTVAWLAAYQMQCSRQVHCSVQWALDGQPNTCWHMTWCRWWCG